MRAVLLAIALALALPARADAVRLLEAEDEAARERIRHVLEAREEVLAVYFIVGDDPVSRTGLALLRDAARRGVRVRLLVDAQWSKIPRDVRTHLEDEGIEVRVYHPFRWTRPRWISRRLHDKLLVVDGRILVAGGRNIESPYFGLGRQVGRRNYVDCDVEVLGEAAAQARAYVLSLWDSREVRAPRRRASPEAAAVAEEDLDRRMRWLSERVARERASPAAREPAVEAGAVRFVHDPVEGKRRGRGVAPELLALLQGASKSVQIESPYLVPSRGLRRGLREALARGVSVRILTNSLASTDNLFPQAGYLPYRKRLTRQGVELWEFPGPACLHTKAAVVDGVTSVVGSYNLDPRSQHLNSEIALVFRSAEIASVVLAQMERNLAGALRIDTRGRPAGSDDPFPGAGRGKRLKVRLLRLIAPLIRKQL